MQQVEQKFQNLFNFAHASEPLIADIQTFLMDWESDDKNVRLQTSGSTSTPKIIIAAKKVLLESARMTGEFFDFNSNKTVLLCLPPKFIAGKMMIIRALSYKMRVIVTEPNNPMNFSEDQEIDFCAMTPYQYEKALQMNPEKLLKIKTVLLGGAPISPSLEKRIVGTKQKVYHSYGMTETYSHVALRKVNAFENNFIALPHVSFSTNAEGCLIIDAPKLGVKKLQTHDIVHLSHDSAFEFIRRKDFVVNYGGI
jgi:O-succinylbenzoic acid--CoA ligase